MLKKLLAGLAALCLCGCIHLKGTVIDDASGKPLRTAVLTIGRPNGIAVYASHGVDQNGAFDFQIASIDETNVYVYDSATDPEAAVHLEKAQLGEKMRIRLRALPRQESPMMMP